MSQGFLKAYREQFPETSIWVDSMLEKNISYALDCGLLGVTTSPTVTPDAIYEEPDVWNEAFCSLHKERPELNQFELLWECMYRFAGERAKLLYPIYDEDGINGRFCIQGNVYDCLNTEKILEQSERIHSLGHNFMMKIPTTAAGLKAMEEIVYNGHSVMATATSTVSQVLMAGAALTRGLERRKSEGKDVKGIALACAMQLGLPEACYKGYAEENGIPVTLEALEYSALAVGKKAYQLLLERYPEVMFVLSNFEKPEHWKDFLGARLILTMPMDYLETMDNTDPASLPNGISKEIPKEWTDELREKVPFYRKAFDEDGMQPEEFEHFEGFCRTVNIFMDVYETGLKAVRLSMFPDPYKAVWQWNHDKQAEG